MLRNTSMIFWSNTLRPVPDTFVGHFTVQEERSDMCVIEHKIVQDYKFRDSSRYVLCIYLNKKQKIARRFYGHPMLRGAIYCASRKYPSALPNASQCASM